MSATQQTAVLTIVNTSGLSADEAGAGAAPLAELLQEAGVSAAWSIAGSVSEQLLERLSEAGQQLAPHVVASGSSDAGALAIAQLRQQISRLRRLGVVAPLAAVDAADEQAAELVLGAGVGISTICEASPMPRAGLFARLVGRGQHSSRHTALRRLRSGLWQLTPALDLLDTSGREVSRLGQLAAGQKLRLKAVAIDAAQFAANGVRHGLRLVRLWEQMDADPAVELLPAAEFVARLQEQVSGQPSRSILRRAA
ncbi:MAG: hypothetical protein JSS27_18035 [Planctomycetes bacterium]|nr:hypothetical protein [Planctomycetota bacterium]